MADIDWKAPLASGYYKLESNQIAALVTFLEMTEPAAPRDGAGTKPAPSLSFTRFTPHQAEDYRALYRAVGEAWGWFSRLSWTSEQLANFFADPAIAAFHVTDQGTSIGLIELDARADNETELAFFGVRPDYIGRGFARPMMDFAIAQAFGRPITRLFVHTCTLDHPSALRFYEQSGFRAYQRAVEIATDPRATGLLPGHAFPHFPRL